MQSRKLSDPVTLRGQITCVSIHVGRAHVDIVELYRAGGFARHVAVGRAAWARVDVERHHVRGVVEQGTGVAVVFIVEVPRERFHSLIEGGVGVGAWARGEGDSVHGGREGDIPRSRVRCARVAKRVEWRNFTLEIVNHTLPINGQLRGNALPHKARLPEKSCRVESSMRESAKFNHTLKNDDN